MATTQIQEGELGKHSGVRSALWLSVFQCDSSLIIHERDHYQEHRSSGSTEDRGLDKVPRTYRAGVISKVIGPQ